MIVGISDKLKITGVDANSVYALKDKSPPRKFGRFLAGHLA
nr:hypothetical protein [Campylobacter showae]